jgi:hypothetical protein
MQSLSILFYGDDRVNDDPPGVTFGLSDLSRFICEGLKNVVDIRIEYVHRHQRDRTTRKEIQGAHKLAWEFVSDYQEIWMFADRCANRDTGDVRTDEPYNELDQYEKAVMLEWMKSNGLFLTGDHSIFNAASADRCAENHVEFVGLGAALGRHVPRAHQLRVWDGPPTDCPASPHDNYNTVDGPDPSVLDSLGDLLQTDFIPQNLLHPSTKHKLFCWVDSTGEVVPVTVFPDHQHEGKVVIPAQQELDQAWPSNSPPPEIVARGTDKRPFASDREYALVAAFDGDPVNVGRMVVDSSFHHYTNLNLFFLVGRDTNGSPTPETALGQIAQYYCNLALWLAPRNIREGLKLDLFSNVAAHPMVRSAKGKDLETLGRGARRAAEILIGPSTLFQVLGVANENGGSFEELVVAAMRSEAEPLLVANGIAQPASATLEKIFGAIIQEFDDFFGAHGLVSESARIDVPRADIVNRGLVRAFRPN